MMNILARTQRSSALLLAGLCSSWVLAAGLPVFWGWENGPLESFQILTLLAGLGVAVVVAWLQRDRAEGKVWCIAAFFWLAMLGRELAWGAVFLPPLHVNDASGPRYTSSVLWWKPAVVWVFTAMLLLSLCWVARLRLLQRVALRWLHERALPWGCLAVFVLAMLLSAVAEGHIRVAMVQEAGASLMAMEEMAECWAYLALCWGQWLLVQHMRAWSASSYLQTMHLPLRSL